MSPAPPADLPAAPPPAPSRIARARARLHAYGRALLDANASPGKLAASVFVGAIVGCTPLFGLHLWVCIALAWLLRLNQPTVYAAANISIPPMVPLVGYACTQAGERLLHGRAVSLSLGEFRAQAHALGYHALATRWFVDWLAGATVVGAAVGLAMAALVYPIARSRQRAAAEPIHRAILDASRRYAAAPRPLRMYAWFKYRLDPCYRAIAAAIPDGAFLVDLGTGLGMLPLVVALLPGQRRALGIDWDAAKLAAGRAACAGLDTVELVEGDARTHPIPPCDAITLVDVLHYYDPAAQRDLLARCAAALRPGGRLLIREGDARRDGGARWTRFVEALAVRIGWNRGEGETRFRPIEELRRELASLGLRVRLEGVSGQLHPGNVLLVAELAG